MKTKNKQQQQKLQTRLIFKRDKQYTYRNSKISENTLRERENSNSKTLFSKDWSLGLWYSRALTTSPC